MYQTRPDDYAAFRCLAGACPQTCCAAWEIVVDPDAQDAYLRLQHPLAAKLRRVLRVDSEGDTYFAQTDGRCPFLCADGLCELQRTLGEQSLCRTCRDFPRWPELLRRAAALPACPPPRMTPVQQTCLAQTIVWRHGMDALDDRDVVFPVRYAAATLRLLDCLAAVSGCTDAQLVVLVTREVENDPEALSRLRAGLQIEPKMNAQEALDHEKM